MLDFRTPRPSIFIDGVFDMGKKGEMRKVLAILSWILLVSPFAMADTLSNPEFSLTTTSMPSGAEFSFIMSASGNFSVDWGDGSVESITKTGNVSMTYSHTYASPGTYTIGMSGAPTGYGSAIIPSISFNTPSNIYIASLSGSLGAVFSTLESGETPRFIETFSGAVNLTSVSSNLFDGATGGIGSMFDKTFYGCSGITSISENLFSGINKNVSGMFNQTFYGCSSLSNIQTQNGNVSYIIPNMFRDITGTNVFNETFNGTGLMTNCPDGTMSDTRELFLPVVSCLIPTNYSINYVMNGGTNFTGAPESYISGTGVTIAGVPTRSGYGFSGWCTDSALKNCSFVPVISADSESDKTFYAKWTLKPVAEFTITTTAMPAGTNFELTINAYGIFTISWGDGTTEKLSHESGTGAKLTYSHTYLESGVYTIELRGDTIRRYPDGKTLSFSNDVKSYINLLDGSLGAVFEPSMVDGSKPSFYDTFNGCNNLEQIPETLFDGVSGIQQDMFRNTFANCSSLTTIPYNLFNSLSGSALNAFNETFANCSSLTSISTENGDVNYIPADMFVNMNNSENMFVNTFSGTGLTDRCPDNMENDDRTYFLPYASCKISGTYNIGYVLNGGTNYANAPTMYERYVGTVINGVPMRDGYLFGGWCDDSELTENCMVNKIIDSDNFGDKLFYAKWVEYIEPEFTITTTEMPVGTEFSFLLSASGDFFVNWGDGTAEHIIRTNVNETTYSHTYINGGNYTIGMSGTATGYNDTVGYAEEYNGTSTYYAPITTIAFHTDSNIYIESVAGSLGAIFGRLNSGSLKVPRFYFTFGGCENLKSIPSTLFSGLAGSAATNMFRGTFYNCSALTNIPDNLFANITNTSSMGGIFRYTFQGCSALTSIPENLFSSFSVSSSMFWDTFEGCKSLTEIPENLFSNIKGAATQLFMYTFKNCSSLKSIPVGLFSGIRGNASYLFTGVFDGCSSLETIPAGLFSGVTGSNTYMFQNTFYGCKNLKSIPVGLFSGVSGSASYMFGSTFRECSSLTSIPADLFVGVSGSATHLFDDTFSKCTGLTSLPDGLFRNISGGATYMFRDTFYTCSNIVSIPENLFGNVSGSATSMFSYTFYKNTKLKEIRLDNGNVVSYIPATMFANANNDTAISFNNIFYGTGLSTSCPNGLLNDGRDYWGGNKVSCMSSCGVGAYFDSDTNSCIPCYAGTYNDVAGATSCNLCPENWYTESRGSVSCSQCPDGLKSYSGSDEYADCGHILHVGDNKLYLRSVRKTTPSLNFMINNHIYYGSMTRDNKTMSKTTDKHLRINYNNEVWSVYDDTVE